jgi:hypothetical protein
MEILYISISNLQKNILCGTNTGFHVFGLEPLKENFKRDLNGGIGIIEQYLQTNLFILVGGGKNPWKPRNILTIWDDYQGKPLTSIECDSNIKKVKIIDIRYRIQE